MTTTMTIAYILGGLFLVLGVLMLVLFFISVKNDKKIEGGIDGMLVRNENNKKNRGEQKPTPPILEEVVKPLPPKKSPRARTQEPLSTESPVMPVRSAEANALLQEMQKESSPAPVLPTTASATPPGASLPAAPLRPAPPQRPQNTTPQRPVQSVPQRPSQVTQNSVPTQRPHPPTERPVQTPVVDPQQAFPTGETRASRRRSSSTEA